MKQVPDPSIGRGEKAEQPPWRLPVRLDLSDAYTLKAAACPRDADKNIHITAFSLGRSGEDGALRQTLAIVVDDAVLTAVPNPDTPNVLVISHLLARATRLIEKKAGPAGLIFCGQQSVDGQPAQVGPRLAQCLDLPFAGHGLKASLCGGVIRIRQRSEDGTSLVEMDLPHTVAFDKIPGESRFPMVRSNMKVSHVMVPMLELSEVPVPLLMIRKTRPTSREIQDVRTCKQTGEDSARQLFQFSSVTGVL